MDLILKALAERFRFASSKGDLNLEDLFHISLTKLNAVAVALHEEAEANTVSFIKPASKAGSMANQKLEIVKAVISYRQAQSEAATQSAKKASERNRINELIAQKQDESLTNLSIEELIAIRDSK